MIHLELPALPVLQREYEEHVQRRHKRRTVKHERNVSRLLARELPAQAGPGDLLRYLDRRVNAGEITTSTANAYLQTAFKLYDLAAVNYGVPNAWRAIKPFPPAPPRPRIVNPLAGLPAAGRRGRVEWWTSGACENDVERGLLWFLYDSGCRIQEALAVRLGAVAADGSLFIDAQRDPHAEAHEVEPPKTRSSAALISLSAEGIEWVRRASIAPERARWGGTWRGWEKRDRLAAALVFPFTGRMLGGLLDRLRGIDPESFPRRVRGVKGGDAWHPFRHAFATDVYDAARAAGHGHAEGIVAAQIALRHKHAEWTATYIEPLRGRDARIDRTALFAMRASQRAAGRAAAGVTEIGGVRGAGDAGSVGGVVPRGEPGAAPGGGGAEVARAAVAFRARGGGAAGVEVGVEVGDVMVPKTEQVSGAPQNRARFVESRLCKGPSGAELWGVSTTT